MISKRGIILTSDLLHEMAQCQLDDILQRYETRFNIKVQDCSVCVGLSTCATENGTLCINSDVPEIADDCFQHARGAKPRSKTLQVLHKQFAAIFDRTLNCDPVPSLTRTIACFQKAGFRHGDLRDAAASFL